MTDERPLRRWLRPSPTIDLIIIGSLAVIDIAGMLIASAGGRVKSPPLRPYELTAALASAGIFWWRRTHPVTVLILSIAAIFIAAAPHRVALVSQSTGLSVALATYAVGSWSKPRFVSLALPGALFAVILYGSRDAGWGVAAAIAAALIALPWIAGYAFRTRRLYVEAVEERLATVERERDERARQAARDERAHIARELHDIVAHHVSVIGVQAGAARVSLDTSPQETRAALLTIESASRQAVGEMRHLLSALREDDTPQDGAESPQPGLADLDALVRSFAAAGLTVVLSKRGDDDLLAPTLDLCCYRIIEEALTNVTRHSASRQAGVDVEVGTSAVHITVNDPGPATPKPGSGRGQVGMRERVGLFGGVLNVGPDGRGGFLVDATIPRNSGAGS